MEHRGYNFGAGPAGLPEPVLLQAKNELLNWQNCGMSVMEMGHRTAKIQALMEETTTLFKEILSIPDDYHVLLLGGAARTQFAMIPMNFIPQDRCADYLITGIWSKMAFDECQHLAQANCVLSNKGSDYLSLPLWDEQRVHSNAAYVYYTSNETVNGIEFFKVPGTGQRPLICDMTSSLLSEPVDITKYSLIFAGAQKNIANAGLVIVIVKDAFVAQIPQDKIIPTMMDYRTHIKHKSLYATPPVFNCYLANKMLQWVKENGGVDEMQRRNKYKSEKLYSYIDNSTFYNCKVSPECRSVLNVCFHLQDDRLDKEFLAGAEKRGLLALGGHREVGGMRASLYNAMPVQGVDALLKYMHEFEKDHI